MRSDPFRFGLDTFTVRGMTGNRVAVEIDGIPAAGGFAIGSFSDSGRSFVDLAFVQRVEVLRGPASSLYGSDAIGGVVAMTHADARDVLAGGRARGLRSEAGYGSGDDGWHAVAIGAARIGAGECLLGYVHREGNETGHCGRRDARPARLPRAIRCSPRRASTAVPGGPLTLTAEGGRLQQTTDVNAFEGLAGSRFVNTVELERRRLWRALPCQRRTRASRPRAPTTQPTGASTGRARTRDQDTLEQRARGAAAHAAGADRPRVSTSRIARSAPSSRRSKAWRAARRGTTFVYGFELAALATRGTARRLADQSQSPARRPDDHPRRDVPAARFPDLRRHRDRRCSCRTRCSLGDRAVDA